MEYTVDITAVCENEKDRLEIEKQISHFMHKELKLSTKSLENNSAEETFDISWQGVGNHFEPIKEKLLNIAKSYQLCFEVEFTTDKAASGKIFIGANAIDNETIYLMEEFNRLLPRMMKRTKNISDKTGIPEENIVMAFKTFIAPSSNSKS